VRLQQQAIAGDRRARFNQHQVTRYDLGKRNSDFLAIVEHGRLGLHHRQKVCDGIGRPAFLPKTKHTAHQHDRQDNDCIGVVTKKQRQHGRANQDQRDRARKLLEQQAHSAQAPARTERVWPIAGEQ
jgi:hypothetical protein